MRDRIILHVDINNFYASAALLYNPDLKGKHFVVCGDPDKRHGVVLAKNESAKKLGVKTGETLLEARRKVKDLFAVPPDFQKYVFLSQKAVSLYKEYTPKVESFGLDECWLDVTDTAHLFGGGVAVAESIRKRMKEEVGLTVSIGVSFTKTFAKLGSDMKKPDAITVISKEEFKKIVWNLPAQEMLFVGRASVTKLQEMNIKTIGDIANSDVIKLNYAFGKNGGRLYQMANGLDDEDVVDAESSYVPESISNGTTTETDLVNVRETQSVVFNLSEYIAFRLRKYGLSASGVSIWIRDKDLSTVSRQGLMATSSNDAKVIADFAMGLVKSIHRFGVDKPIRMVTVGTYELKKPVEERVQTSLFDEQEEKTGPINEKLDGLRKKYGYGILMRGVEINSPGINAKDLDGYIPFDRNNARKGDDPEGE